MYLDDHIYNSSSGGRGWLSSITGHSPNFGRAGSPAATGGTGPGAGPSPHESPEFVAAAAAGGPDPEAGGTRNNPIIIPDDPYNPDQYNGRGVNGPIDSHENRWERCRVAAILEEHIPAQGREWRTLAECGISRDHQELIGRVLQRNPNSGAYMRWALQGIPLSQTEINPTLVWFMRNTSFKLP